MAKIAEPASASEPARPLEIVRMYDSASRTVRPFEPLEPGHLRIYNCGPTVYDWQTIGNLYSYVVADVVRRTFEYLGYRVMQVMNITDVGHIVGDVDEGEDKMDLAARREGRDPLSLAAMYTERFMDDRRKLNIFVPQHVTKATEHIPLMIELIERLIANGHAYMAADGVYFDVTSFPRYGLRLNVESPEQRMAGARVEVNPNKRHPFDFALWRAAKPGDLQQWDSPWGRGNPGWHIECSAMSMHYLGETFDIHTGGEDHLFPHHECEIAQSEGATGKPFVRYWLHVHFLTVDGRAMHKSLDNYHVVSDLEKWGFEPLAFRLQGLGVGYRKALDFTRQGLADAQKRLESWRSATAEALLDRADLHRKDLGIPSEGVLGDVDPDDPIHRSFVDAITDDFNTPRALAAAEDAITLANAGDREQRARGLALLFDMDRVLGLGLREHAMAAVSVDDDIRALLSEREAARARGDYARSDELRKQLEQRGIRVRDTKDGQRWERIPGDRKR